MVASSAQVKSWVAQAIKVLEQHGVPAGKLDPNAIALIIQHESGGNPNAVNHWDINAQEGHPSEGLMQTIAPTFSEYALPGHGNILDPVDNIIAGCQYAISRYGSLDNVPGVVAVAHGGSYVGYSVIRASCSMSRRSAACIAYIIVMSYFAVMISSSVCAGCRSRRGARTRPAVHLYDASWQPNVTGGDVRTSPPATLTADTPPPP
jgi:hypothetical protein